MKHIQLVTMALVALTMLGKVSSVWAGSSTLSLDPATRAVNIGDIFNLTIKLSTGGDSINTVTSILSFDKTLLKAISADSSGSAFPIEFESQFDNASGMYRSTRAVPRPGVNGSDILVLKVNFQAVGQGTATVSFTDASAAYRNNDLQDNLGSKTGSTVTINATGATTPTPIPPTPTASPPTSTPSPGAQEPSATPTPTATSTPSQTPGNPSSGPTNPDLPDGGVAWPTMLTLGLGSFFVFGGSKLLRFLK